MVAGGGGRSSMGTSSLGGEGGDLSNSAIGASSGIGDTELLSIADNFIGDTLAILKTFNTPGTPEERSLVATAQNASTQHAQVQLILSLRSRSTYSIKAAWNVRDAGELLHYSPTFPVRCRPVSGLAPEQLQNLEAIKVLFIVVLLGVLVPSLV